jgi:hypothetical protein
MRVTREVNFLDSRTFQSDKIKFTGVIGRAGFRISRSIKKGDTFLPLLIGKMEDTPRGSIIFLEYRLFPSAIFFLAFWSLVLFSFAMYYLLVIPQLIYALSCFLLGLGNYALGLLFFNRQYKLSRNLFHELINFQLKDKY